LALAELELEEGNLSDGENIARQAVAEFSKENDVDTLAGAKIVLARILLAQSKNQAAQEMVADAKKLASTGGTRATQFEAAIAEAELRTATGNAAEAASSLKNIASQSHAAGFVNEEFEARLDLGEIEMKSGMADGRAELESLDRDARNKRFLLIARKAAAKRGHR
jgi:hypothetical protein